MKYSIEQIQLAEELLRTVGGLSENDLHAGISRLGKKPTRTGPISQARYDGFKIAKGALIVELNKIVLSVDTH